MPLLWTLCQRQPGAALQVLVQHVLRRAARRLVRGRAAEKLAAEHPAHFRSP